MKNKLLFLILLISLNSYACEVKNDNYNIKLLYQNGYISYVLNTKSGADVELLNSVYNIGFEIKDYKFSETKFDMNNIKDRYNYMLMGNGNYFSYYMVYGNGSQRIILPIPSNNLFKHKSVDNKINLAKFISEFRSIQEKEKNDIDNFQNILPYGEKILIPKIKIILDPEIKTCIDFTGEPFKYNLGNKYIYEFNTWWYSFKEKMKQIWKAIIE